MTNAQPTPYSIESISRIAQNLGVKGIAVVYASPKHRGTREYYLVSDHETYAEAYSELVRLQAAHRNQERG